MAIELILDTRSESAEADISFEEARVVRTGLVSGIPATARSDPYVLMRAVHESGGPALGDEHPYDSALRLNRIVARPGSGTNDAEIQFHYGGLEQQSVMFVEDNTVLATEQTSVDLEGFVIQAKYSYGRTITVQGYETWEEKEIAHTVTMPFLVPRRSITVSGILLGPPAPKAWSRNTVGSVNRNPWPTKVLLWGGDEPDKRGWWLCTGVQSTTDHRNFSGFNKKVQPYRVRASFQSKVYKSWMSTGVFRNAYGSVPIDVGNTPEKAAEIKALVEGEYSIEQQHDCNGIVAVGPYRMAAFFSIFGF